MISRVFFIFKFYVASRNFIFFILFNFIKASEILNISNFKNLLKNDPNPTRYDKNKESNYFLNISNYQVNSAINQINSDIKLAHKERHKNANIYSNYLAGIEKVYYKKYVKNEKDCYLSFPILCENRDNLYKYLIKNNLDISKYFYRDCNQISIFKKFKNQCPKAKYISDHVLMLPLYPGFPLKKIKLICSKIKEFYSLS